MTDTPNAQSLRQRMLAYLAAGVNEAGHAFDGKSGRFLASNGGWAVTRQDVIFPLALLFTTPGTKHHRSAKILHLAMRGGDALRDAQGPTGDWEFIKVDGSTWGRVFMPWSIYHWLEAFALLRGTLGDARRKRWARGLTLACDGVAREIERPLSHNIPCWKGMSLVRAAELFDRPDWRDIGTRQSRFIADHQHPDGYWPEGDGPTTHYNLVYVHALGLYHAFTGDGHVLPALRRAAAFHAAFTYPDASAVETLDGRVKYTPEPCVTGLPGLGVTPHGRALAALIVEKATRHVADDPHGTTWRKNQAPLSPHLASAFQHLRDGDAALPPPCANAARVVHAKRALSLRQRPWFACVSGYAPAPLARHELSRNRWIMTRSNLLSIYHDRLGLIIGGGNSKHDPAFATFEVTIDGVSQVEPDSVAFSRRGIAEIARFRFASQVCILRLTTHSHKRIELTFESPRQPSKRCQITAGFTMRIPAGDRLRWRSTGPHPADTSAIADPRRSVQFHWTPAHRHRNCTLESTRWRLEMPIDSGMSYPVYPFNPYAIDNTATPEEAIASVYARFNNVKAKRFLLSIK